MAYSRAAESGYGIGFVFSEDDRLVGVDLDDCRDAETGRPNEDARDIVRALDSYTEVSPSGTGYHVILEGSLPDGRNRRGGIEMYDTARFFTVTGLHVEGTPASVEARTEELSAVHRERVGTDTREQRAGSSQRAQSSLSDSELIRRAGVAKNGKKFQRLWPGQTTGYASQSEVDMALCCLLAFWTGGDANRMDTLFRDSGLMREKWDEQHYSDGSTYGEVTVARAVDVTDEFYDPGHGGQDDSSHESREPELRGQRAYDAERIRLLEQCIQELEALLGLKKERIHTLESQITDDKAAPSEAVDETDAGGATADTESSRSLLGRLWKFRG